MASLIAGTIHIEFVYEMGEPHPEIRMTTDNGMGEGLDSITLRGILLTCAVTDIPPHTEEPS